MKKHLYPAVPELISRLAIGAVFVQTGWGKLHNLKDVTEYFVSLHIPFAEIQAPMVSGLEFVAGLFVFLGFFTRLSSLPLIAIMLVAIGTAKWEDATDLSSIFGFSESLYIVILLWLVAHGSSFFSVDVLIKKLRSRKPANERLKK